MPSKDVDAVREGDGRFVIATDEEDPLLRRVIEQDSAVPLMSYLDSPPLASVSSAMCIRGKPLAVLQV